MVFFSSLAAAAAQRDQIRRNRALLAIAEDYEREQAEAIRIRNANRGRTFKCGPWQWTTWTFAGAPFCHVVHKKK